MGDSQGFCEWQFSVRATTIPGETVGVVGSCPALGNWKHQKALELTSGEEGDVWRGTIRLPQDSPIQYRYFVCVIIPSDGERLLETARVVKRWETHPDPRAILPKDLARGGGREDVEEFGLVGGMQQVERGWLSSETVVQLKMFNDPIKLWKRRLQGRQLLIKVTPVLLEKGVTPESLLRSGESSLDESMDTLELNGSNGGRSNWPITELAVMNEEDCEFRPQEQFGRVFKEGDFFNFQIQVFYPDTVAYMVDLYAHSSRANEDEVPTHVGFCYILPSVLRLSEGQAIVPITGLRHQPIGQLTVEYIKVAPLPEFECDMSVAYSRYWRHTWCGLDVGHRGSGNSFKHQTTGMAEVRENTIASLAQAARHGADFVEFDVQLSRDLVPVIYHDFHVCISMKRKRTEGETDLLTLPVKDLTMEQLHLLKDINSSFLSKVLHICERDSISGRVYHLEEGRDRLQPRFFDEDLEDHQPFPTLQNALETLDPHVGFNIEIKWTMQRKDGTFELYHPFDLNLYLDVVLATVLTHGGSRKIVFSCFHPDICSMIRLKQNKYPVMFLTQGTTSKYPHYYDQRCQDIAMAIHFARSAGILGVNAHTEDLLRDSSQVKQVRDAGLVLFCWGDDNNDAETIKHLKALGLHGVIYDKIDQLGVKEVKESIFLVEARESQKSMIAALSHPTITNNDKVTAETTQQNSGCGSESENITIPVAQATASESC